MSGATGLLEGRRDDQALWARPILATFGPLARDIEREFIRRSHPVERPANLYLRRVYEYWQAAHPIVQKIRWPDEIDTWANRLAEGCRKQGVGSVCAGWDLLPPKGSPEARQRRGEDFQYWRMQLRKMAARWWDQFMRLCGFVHRHKQLYCSDHALKWYSQRQSKNRDTLETLLACSDQGDELPLLDVVNASTANPKNRFIECMVRVRGMDEWAVENGWLGMMATITCPSRLHARRWLSGDPNPKYDESTPRDSHEYLGRVFSRIRAKLARDNVPWKGFRVAEPHHDGCAHWHLLIFCPPQFYAEVQSIIRRYAMQESPAEAGASERRVQFERIDRSKGDAASYVAKYISKSLDGIGIESDRFGVPGETAAERVVAWARTWGIRQFAFFGAPSVSIYREYRRVDEEPVGLHGEFWDACRNYRWAEFMRLLEREPVRLVRDLRPREDRYGDAVPDCLKPIVALEIGPIPLLTRLKQWVIKKVPSFAVTGGDGPRTCITNCTGTGKMP